MLFLRIQISPMKKNIAPCLRPLVLLVVLWVTSIGLYAQTTYFSRASTAWNLNTTWSTVSHVSAVNIGTFPVAGDIVNIGGGFTVTITTPAACATLNIANNSTLNAGHGLAVSGITTVGTGTGGTLNITALPGAKTFTGLVTINNGGLWNEAVNEAIIFQGGITNNGTFTAGTGTHTFNTNSQALTGTFTIPSVTVTGGAIVLTNNNTLTVNTALSGTGRITQGTNAVLNIGGTSGITNMTATASGNTVNYTGVAQTVRNVNYVNLGLSGSGAKTLAVGTTSITGNLTLSGTVFTSAVIGLTIGGSVNIGSGTSFTAGAFTHNVAGDWANNGTFTGPGGTMIFNGAAQNITGGATTFNDVTLSGTGTKTFGVSPTLAIAGTLSINNGVVASMNNANTHTSNALVLGGAIQQLGTWGSTISAATNQNNTFFSGNGLVTVATGANTYYSIAGTAWNLNTTWSNTGFGGLAAAGTPGAGDFVYIGGGFTVTIAGAETCSALFFDAGTSVTNTLTISSGSLTVSGAITIPQTVVSGSNILNVGAGTLTASSIDFTSTPGGAGHQLTISTGTATISGNVTGIGVSSTIQFTGAGLLQVGGSIFTSANGTLTSVAGSTVEYTGAAQTVQALGYNNLTLSGTGNKTLAATTTIGGNLSIGNNTTFVVGAFTLTVSGTTAVGGGTSGILSITSATGVKTFGGLVTISNGGTWTNITEGVTFQSGITNNGTFTAGTGVHTFNTNSQALTGTFTIPSVTVTGGAIVLTNNNTLTVNTALSGTGRITQGTNAVLNIVGTSGITNMTATAIGNTVNYTGAAQTVNNNGYVNLGLSGSGVKTLQGGTTSITGDLSLIGTVSTTGVIGLTIGGSMNIGSGTSFTAGAFTHNVGGDCTNNGTFTGTGCTMIFNGAAQNITGGATTFNDVTLSGTGTKTFGVNPTLAIVGTLSINNGVVASLSNANTHTPNALVLGGAIQQLGTWGSTISAATNQNNTFFSGNGLVTVATGANTYYSIAGTAWNLNTTWSNTGFGGLAAAGTPGAGDFVYIGGGFTVTIAGAETCSALFFDAGTSVTNTLTISSGSLTVSGAITIPQTVVSGSNILNVGAGTLTASSIDFTSTPGGAGHQLTISTGTATISGNVTGIGVSSTIQFTGAGLLQVGGSIFTSANGTLTSVAGSTVEYTGAAQTVQALGYNNLTLSGTGNKTLAATTTIGGNLSIGNNTTFVVGAFTLTVSGTTAVGGGTSGILSITSATGVKTFGGLVTISNGGTWTNITEGVTFQSGITNNGTFTAGTGVHTFNTNSQALTGTFTIPSVTVTGGAIVLTNNNTLTVNTALSGSGRITQGNNAVLNIVGTSGITNMTATAIGNTVNYTGAAQTVNNNGYVNLGLSGSGVKTLQGGTTSITGDLRLIGTVSTTGVIGLTIGGDLNIGSGTSFSAGAFNPHNVAGDFVNNGTFNNDFGTVIFDGITQQTISGSTVTNFNNITITNLSGAVLVESNQNLLGVLTLEANVIFDADGASNTSVFTLISSADSPTADASIATLPDGAQVVGNVTVQRYMAIEGGTGNNGRIYRYISSPVQNAPVSQIQARIPVTGSFTGTSTCSGCLTNQSMFLYNESVITDTNGSGGNNVDDGYEDFPANANTETLTSGRGYTLFVRANVNPISGAGSALWDVRGAINSGTIDYSSFTTFNSSTILLNDGWNLVGNPYPATIDWNAATGWTKTGINNAIYMLDNGMASPVFATYIGGVGVNGGSQYIAAGQAFWVKSDGGPIDFQSTEDVKVAGQPTTFFREGAPDHMVRATLKQGNISDETVIRFLDSATERFDSELDAYKLSNSVFNLSSVSGDTKYAINTLPALGCASFIQLDVSNVTSGTYQLELSQFDSFDQSMELKLIDDYLGQAIDIRQNALYEFSVTGDTKSYGNRFKIVFEQGEINSSIIPEGDSGLCAGQPYNILLPTTESNVLYYASLGGTIVSEGFAGTGSSLSISVDASKLTDGENSILVFARRLTCDARVELDEPVTVVVDNIYKIQSITEGSACQSGSVLLAASGAPLAGSYHWYESLAAADPIAGAIGNTLQTPVLDKSKTFYVAAVNSFGCEGERTAVKADVTKFDEVVVTEVEAGVLSSSYESGNVWYFNETAIPGATKQTVSVTESGVYKVEVSIGNCKSTSTRQYSITGLETDLPGTGVSFYPNPVSDILTVRVANSDNINRVDLIANTGVRLESAMIKNNEAVIDMRNHPSGLYLIKLIRTNNSVSTFKILRK